MQMVLTPNDLFSWNNKYSKYMVIILCYIHCNEFTSHLPAMHVNLLCACWYSWAVKGSSSLSFCRLSISLWFTSYLLLCPKLTDAPYSGYGAPPPSFSKMASSFTGSAHSPFLGRKTIHSVLWFFFSKNNIILNTFPQRNSAILLNRAILAWSGPFVKEYFLLQETFCYRRRFVMETFSYRRRFVKETFC